MTRRAMDAVLEQLHRHVQTPEGRAALVRRICTPLTEEEYRRGMERGILTDPVLYRKVKRPMRDRGGVRRSPCGIWTGPSRISSGTPGTRISKTEYEPSSKRTRTRYEVDLPGLSDREPYSLPVITAGLFFRHRTGKEGDLPGRYETAAGRIKKNGCVRRPEVMPFRRMIRERMQS